VLAEVEALHYLAAFYVEQHGIIGKVVGYQKHFLPLRFNDCQPARISRCDVAGMLRVLRRRALAALKGP